MKRTLQPKKRQLTENINLIRKIAWSFHHSTGEDWDDLFQEAALAYCQALKSYNPKKGKITTYMWWSITSHLKSYLKYQEKQNGHILSVEDLLTVDSPVNGSPLFESLSKEAIQIADMILSLPTVFDSMSPESAERNITRVLTKRKGWSRKKAWCGIRDLKLAFA